MRTFSGISVGKKKGAPSIEDIATMQGRICRFNGATKFYWPVLLHSLAVADLAQSEYNIPYLTLCALLHDAAETIISDIPRDIKTRQQERLERYYLANIYSALGIKWPNFMERSHIAVVDRRVGYAEAALFGPSNTADDFPLGRIPSDIFAENIVSQYTKFTFEDVLLPDGKYVKQYIDRVKSLL